MEKEKQELLEFSKRWDEAMVSNNADEIGKFMSDDWKIVGSDGITSKSSFLQFISSGILTHNRMDSDETNIDVYGNTGILVSRGTSAGTYNGDNFSLYEWSTSVFIKTEGKWRCVITMLTPADKSK
ncbi:MAG TPA: nuclear transport factor 2 family protein [Chitinophagaceae bacterium]|nr:nuclear transport factor 2 family protein [Chitinophagaceae bacterium]